jgi:hypothetical protein
MTFGLQHCQKSLKPEAEKWLLDHNKKLPKIAKTRSWKMAFGLQYCQKSLKPEKLKNGVWIAISPKTAKTRGWKMAFGLQYCQKLLKPEAEKWHLDCN